MGRNKGPVPPSVEGELIKAATEAGFEWSELCTIDNEGCIFPSFNDIATAVY